MEKICRQIRSTESLHDGVDDITLDTIIKKLSGKPLQDIILTDKLLYSILGYLNELETLRSSKKDRISMKYIEEWRRDNKKLFNKLDKNNIDDRTTANDIHFSVSKIHEEVSEAVAAHKSGDMDHTLDECGDVFQSTIGLIMALDIPLEEALYCGFDKIKRRFSVLKADPKNTWEDAKKIHPK